ncbi:MAG: hypothetical protein HPY75_14775 [Actinobacteria bacterium]|nr:hypothetical protein [Actinomycetota bacterium]
MKRLLFLLGVAFLAAILLAGCGNGGASQPEPIQDQPRDTQNDAVVEEELAPEEETTFTAAELAKFDGKGGEPAYVAVDGVVYDVTGSPNWPEGVHTPCNLDAMAGRDLSDILDQAPASMRGFIQSKPVVGKLEE